MSYYQAAPVYLCSELVNVRYTGNNRSYAATTANLEEISHYGASLSLERPLRTGAAVEIVIQGQILRGRVSSWSCDELGYTTWVEFDSDSQWSPERFRPRHMLDLNAMRGPLNHAA